MTERLDRRDGQRQARAGRRGAACWLVPIGLLGLLVSCRAPVTYREARARPVEVTPPVAPVATSATVDEAAPAVGDPTASPVAATTSSAAADTTAEVSPADPKASGTAPGMPEPFERQEQWGYRSSDGHVVIAPRFVLAQPFSPTGIAAVIDEQGWAYVDTAGKILVRPLLVDNGPDEFREGLARFVHQGKVGYFDEEGAVVIAPSVDFGLPFEQGRARVCSGCTKEPDGEHFRVVGGRWWWIDRQGKEQGPATAPAPRR